MQTLEIIAYRRPTLQRKETTAFRKTGNVPSVVYGASGVQHIAVPAILFRPLLRNQEAYFIELNIEGDKVRCILQAIQHHPVSDNILHADFLELSAKPILIDIPLRLVGRAPGLAQGGHLYRRLRTIRIKASPADVPSTVEVDISELNLGDTIKVRDLPTGKYSIQDNPVLPVVTVQASRASRVATEEETTPAEVATEEAK